MVLVLVAIAVLALAVAAGRWVYAAVVVILVLVSVILRRRSKPVQLIFEVGQHELHQVVFRFDKFWGTLSVTVDGRPVKRDLRMFSVTLTKTYHFKVGDREVHDVRIEKDRELVLAGARPQPIRAYVDNVIVAEAVA